MNDVISERRSAMDASNKKERRLYMFKFLKTYVRACNAYWKTQGTNVVDATLKFWLGK